MLTNNPPSQRNAPNELSGRPLNTPLVSPQGRLDHLTIFSKKGVVSSAPGVILKSTIPYLGKPDSAEVQLRIAKKILGMDADFQRAITLPKKSPRPLQSVDFNQKVGIGVPAARRTPNELENQIDDDGIFLDDGFDMSAFLDFLDQNFPYRFVVLSELVRALDPHLADLLSPLPQKVLTRGELLRLIRAPESLGEMRRRDWRMRSEGGLSGKSRKLLAGVLVTTFRSLQQKQTF